METMPRRRLLTTFLAMLLIASAPSPAWGWGGTGHQIVCLIAEEHLTPKAKSLIHDLLGADVGYLGRGDCQLGR
jgi:hypothetical protein